MTEIVAELGNNHMGSLENVKRMIDTCASAGCSYVKFQKRDINSLYTDEELSQYRVSPWGKTYGDYRRAVEFGFHEYDEIDRYCKSRIPWFASPWDKSSVAFLSQFDVPFIKIASASVTDFELLEEISILHKPVILSTGMSDWGMIDKALDVLGRANVYAILHCIGTYPNKIEELNLKCIPAMKERYPYCKIGYSNHHPSIIPTMVAVTLGAEIIEFHMTMDRTWYGSDQSASLEPQSVWRITKGIENIEKGLGVPRRFITKGEERR